MYLRGLGVAQDYQKAFKWFRLAAVQGFVDAQFNLGAMYTEGQGIPQDYGEAAKWYRLAAAQGDATAQYNLGYMNYKGQGVLQNSIEAYKWMTLAAAQGYARAVKWEETLAKKMTPAQLAEAQRLAMEWKPKGK